MHLLDLLPQIINLILLCKGELEINPKDKLYKKTTVKLPSKGPSHLPDDTKHTKVTSTRNAKELGVSFDNPMKANTLQNVNKVI